jgi:hypothetical protein
MCSASTTASLPPVHAQRACQPGHMHLVLSQLLAMSQAACFVPGCQLDGMQQQGLSYPPCFGPGVSTLPQLWAGLPLATCHVGSTSLSVHQPGSYFRIRILQHAVLRQSPSRTVAPQLCDPPGLWFCISHQLFFGPRLSIATCSMYLSANH